MSRKSGRRVEQKVISRLKQDAAEIERELENVRSLGLIKRSRLRERLRQLREFLVPPDDPITAG